jgi:hypothetical protein
MRLQREPQQSWLWRDVSTLIQDFRHDKDTPVMIPAPALSLVLIAAGGAIGLESPPLPALGKIGQLRGNCF